MSWTATVITIFPAMFPGPLAHSLAGRALGDGRGSLRRRGELCGRPARISAIYAAAAMARPRRARGAGLGPPREHPRLAAPRGRADDARASPRPVGAPGRNPGNPIRRHEGEN